MTKAQRIKKRRVIRQTPLMRWILCTKRIPNVSRMLPPDWDHGSNYRNLGIMASVCNQDELARDLPRLIALKETLGVFWIGLSVEPQLAPISFAGREDEARKLDWVIVGGESTQQFLARPFHLEWAEQLLLQVRALDVPYFQKQCGSTAFHHGKRFRTQDPADADANEWPVHLRVQRWPRLYDHEESHVSQPTML